MKNLLSVATILLLAIVPLACNKNIALPTPFSPNAAPTPVPTSTSALVLTATSSPTPQPSVTAVPTATSTPIPTSTSTADFTATLTPLSNNNTACAYTTANLPSIVNMTFYVAMTPVQVISPAVTPVSLGSGMTMISVPPVLRNLSDWQAFYGAWVGSTSIPAPTVDFSTQMVIIYGANSICSGTSYTVNSACPTNGQIVVSITATTSCITCQAINDVWTPLAVVVPQSNLPVILESDNIYLCGLNAFPTPTATP
jgi:hypothetical protein